MITINLDKAKTVAHDRRRFARSVEFMPLDEIIAKQIPGSDALAAEAQRQAIRDRYVDLQNEIDAAAGAQELKPIMDALNATIGVNGA
jgi:hypothetical protein